MCRYLDKCVLSTCSRFGSHAPGMLKLHGGGEMTSWSRCIRPGHWSRTSLGLEEESRGASQFS